MLAELVVGLALDCSRKLMVGLAQDCSRKIVVLDRTPPPAKMCLGHSQWN